MRQHTKCTIANLFLILLVWALLVAVPNVVAGRVLSLWLNIPIALVALVLSGYTVQHLLSGIVNRAICGELPTTMHQKGTNGNGDVGA